MKKTALIVASLILISLTIFTIKFVTTSTATNTKRSGFYIGNQIWNGEITITGDTTILGNLTILPNTTIKFELGDDQNSGDEVAADGYNDKDPTRLKSYTTTHSSLLVLRKLSAVGTKDQPITFTSAAIKPNYADWEALLFMYDGSAVDHVTVEYSRNGINPIGNQPNSIIKNSKVNHTLWGAISSAESTIQVIDNYLSDCGHEGIDVVHKGSQIIKGNTIENCHAGIVVLGGSSIIENNTIKDCGDAIGIDKNASPKVSNNIVTLAAPDATREWRYGNFSYKLFGDPEIN